MGGVECAFLFVYLSAQHFKWSVVCVNISKCAQRYCRKFVIVSGSVINLELIARLYMWVALLW